MKEWIPVLCVGLMAACGSEGKEDPEESTEKDAALRVMVDAEQGDVAEQARWSVRSCDRQSEVMDKTEPIDEWTREVMTPSHIGDGDLFMEEYLEVAAGCYDLEVELLDALGEAIAECTTVRGWRVEVERQDTAEVVMFSRCDGVDDEPKIESLRFHPTAFAECGDEIDVCATVDSDGLGVALDWERIGDTPLAQPIETSRPKSEDGRVRQCAYLVPGYHGETRLQLRAISGRAEVVDGGDTVLFAEPHRALFSTFLECPTKK